MSRLDDVAAGVRESFHEAVLEARSDYGCDVVLVSPGSVADVLRMLRDGFGYDLLSDITAIDWLPRRPRFDLNYELYSTADHHRLRVKVQLDGDDPSVPSVVDVWPGADYPEREVYDFFGITFMGHPNLSRLFMPDEWIGHPLRKDYPVGGVPVEYKIEPSYVGEKVVSEDLRPAAGGVPARLARDRGLLSPWTWTGQPASGVHPERPERPQEPDAGSEGRHG